MKILVLKSSGNRNGSSNLLASAFVRGVLENGHDVMEYDVFRADIRPCFGCNGCGGMVFVMPVYYYNWPAKLKAVVDRFYSFSGELTAMRKKTALLAVAADDAPEAFDVTEAYYRRLCGYMQFENVGTVFGRGCPTPDRFLHLRRPQGTSASARAHPGREGGRAVAGPDPPGEGGAAFLRASRSPGSRL